MKLKYQNKESEIGLIDSYGQLISFDKAYFSIDDGEFNKLSLLYNDNGKLIYLQTEKDFNLFINKRKYINKIIEIEIIEKRKNEDNNSINLNQSECTTISDNITFNTCLNSNNSKEEKITKNKTNENPNVSELMKQLEEYKKELKNKDE